MALAVETTGIQDSRGAPSRERVELILQSLDRLPTLAPVVARLLSLTSSDASSAREVTEVLQADPALSAGLLRLAHSAHSGVASHRLTVQQAVTLLGFHAVRSAVLCRQFFDVFRGNKQEDCAHRSELWRHCLAVAIAAEWIAKNSQAGVQTGEAFLCGLLHDIGKIALDTCLPKSYARVVERTIARGECVCDVERDILGLDHMIAGKRVVTRWGLSQPIIECVWLHHHDPDELPGSIAAARLIRVVHLADHVVRRAGIGFSGYRSTANLNRLAAGLGLSAEALSTLADWLPDRAKQLEDALGVGGDGPPETALNEAALGHLRRANASLTETNRHLNARGTCFEILANFADRMTGMAAAPDVCLAASVSITASLPSTAALTFGFAERDGGCFYCAWSARGRGAADTSVLEQADFAEALDPTIAVSLGRAPREMQRIWEACLGERAAGEMWLLSFSSPGARGGVLIAGEQSAVAALMESQVDARTVARSVGGALASAFAQNRSERMAEELLDLNRRLREAQADLLRARSLTMVAEMAAGAAHELNNPLAVISGRAQIDGQKTEDPELRKSFETIVAQTNKAAQIVLELMSFAKPDRPTPIEQPVRSVLEAVFQHWQSKEPGRAARISVSVHEPGSTIYADGAQLIESLNAVVANALDATDRGGRVYVNSACGPSDETLRIVIRDEGAGMTPDVLEHAVDPFFSNRDAGRGRGLGLSRAHRFIEINGGKLWLQSTRNLGTTVTIELPARAPAGGT
jgi:putative nucleotidyltransferase with HDIG domain